MPLQIHFQFEDFSVLISQIYGGSILFCDPQKRIEKATSEAAIWLCGVYSPYNNNALKVRRRLSHVYRVAPCTSLSHTAPSIFSQTPAPFPFSRELSSATSTVICKPTHDFPHCLIPVIPVQSCFYNAINSHAFLKYSSTPAIPWCQFFRS